MKGIKMRRLFRVLPAIAALLLSSLSLVSGPAVFGQEGTRAADCAAASPQENATTVNRFFEAIDARTDVNAMLADELVAHFSSRDVRHNSVAEWIANRLANFPDLHIAIENTVAEGDQVAVLTYWTGTRPEAMEDSDSGAAADWVGAFFFRLECGKIAEIWFVADNFGLLQDTGLITAEELRGGAAMATPAP
jgi:predicted ester cyclase